MTEEQRSIVNRFVGMAKEAVRTTEHTGHDRTRRYDEEGGVYRARWGLGFPGRPLHH